MVLLIAVKEFMILAIYQGIIKLYAVITVLLENQLPDSPFAVVPNLLTPRSKIIAVRIMAQEIIAAEILRQLHMQAVPLSLILAVLNGKMQGLLPLLQGAVRLIHRSKPIILLSATSVQLPQVYLNHVVMLG